MSFSTLAFFERGHLRPAFQERNNRSGKACRRHHYVHDKPSHAPVAVHVSLDEEEDISVQSGL
jgi:hypothetical protein